MKKLFLYVIPTLLLLTGAAVPESPEYTVSMHREVIDDYPYTFYTFADTAGNRLNDVRYAEAYPFSGDRALVRETKKYGYIDPAGELAIPYQFDAALSFGDQGFDKDLAIVRFAFRDELREFITPWTYGDSEMVLINRRGEAVTPRYEVIRPVKYELAVVVETRRNHGLPVGIAEPNKVPDACKWGCIDKYGREVIPCVYDRIFGINEALLLAQKDGKWGAVDSRGKEVIPFIHDFCRYRSGRRQVFSSDWDGGWPNMSRVTLGKGRIDMYDGDRKTVYDEFGRKLK